MGFTAVETVRVMGAWYPISGRGNGRFRVGPTLAASSKGAVVIFAVQTHAVGAHDAQGVAVVLGVTPGTTEV